MLSSVIKSTANTGLITKATNKEANNVKIKVIGINFINSPIIPGQNNNGKNGAIVVNVPENTGTITSPAAILAAVLISCFPW